jgi:putative ABC transport system permease protein
VSPGYFAALDIALRRGRVFTDRDAATSPMVAVIDETFARKHFPGEDPIGRGLDIGNGTDGFVEIVGVVADVHHAGLHLSTEPTMYVPFVQDPFSTMSIVIRSTGDPLAMVPAVRAIMQDIDRDAPPFAIAALETIVGGSMAGRRFSMLLLGVFAVVALFLAAVGLYGVLSYTVMQRTQEIGIRLAIGAAPGQLLRLVVRDGLKLTVAGIVLGLAGALALSQFVRALLFDLTPFDPVSYLLPAVVLLAVATLACHLPARRAMRVDPILALRSE